MYEKMIHPYLESFIRSCRHDRDLRNGIHELKKALVTRQFNRLHERILKAIAPLSTAEREAILKVYNGHNADMDPAVLQTLRNAKIAGLSGSLTAFGMRVAAVLKQRRAEQEVVTP
jgi:hypothetical protein